ncbi:uncharacterized protein F5Z01DRAFT_169635 [Emericellopsis atlantica]|uniref:Carboxymethylenebutenolidase n=1 Tax=Emericellopsis atlantica TaxID=2614577 RepID=A0A9P7ZJN4_9HYPO|nr:uncharacterized protein F5Z01DRAFT_169635 [Emericellopsis atlantica]KAG9252967.1 hypothetical protein F5Z01DRAFT_169635 [Emericellopsis atlantica]
MYADITKPPAPLPSPDLQKLAQGIALLPPLSRRGTGPGLILLTTPEATDEAITITDKSPSPLVKWAEEGYAVVQIPSSILASVSAEDALKEAIEGLGACAKCEPKGKIGLVAYSARLWKSVSGILDQFPSIVANVVYLDEADVQDLATSPNPTLRHIVGPTAPPAPKSATLVEHRYPSVQSFNFVSPNHAHFHYNTDSVAHTRTLQFLKPRMDGPYFDLESIWDEHCYYEFADRSVEHTMSTMVQEPYVNHAPTLTGGIGRAKLTDFYRHNFIFNNSADTDLELTSRTVGIDRVIDEFLFKFTHDRELDWLLPGVPATNLKVQVPFTAVVNIRGDRLYHEHISWDQGTVLRQLGLMPEYLPFPYKVDGKEGDWEYKVPVGGVEVAEKMRDRNSVQSNEMFGFKIREKKR